MKLSLWQFAETYGLSPTHYSPYVVSAEALSFLQRGGGRSLAFASEKYSEVASALHSQPLAIWKHLCLSNIDNSCLIHRDAPVINTLWF